jgi:hypothetical protein
MGRLTAYIALCLLITAGAALAIQLTWDENDPVPDGYRLYQRTEPGAYDYDNPIWEGIAPPSDDLTGHAYGETYCWVVRAYTGDDVSADSNEVCLTIGANDLTTPTTGLCGSVGGTDSATRADSGIFRHYLDRQRVDDTFR